MINFNDYASKNKTKHNLKQPYISVNLHSLLIIGGSGSGKTIVLLNFINNLSDIDKIYFYAKDPYEEKYQFLINKRESPGLKYFNDPKIFIEYSNDTQVVYESIKEYNLGKMLIVFDDMITDMINNKKNLIQLQLNCLLEVEN